MSDQAPPPYGEQPGPYGQQPPGQAPPPAGYGYGQPGFPPPDHPQATTILVLGILGLVLCQVLAPFAWVMGNKAVKEIDASQGRLGGRGSANAGRICGMIGSILLGLSILFGLFAVVLVLIAAGSSSS